MDLSYFQGIEKFPINTFIDTSAQTNRPLPLFNYFSHITLMDIRQSHKPTEFVELSWLPRHLSLSGRLLSRIAGSQIFEGVRDDRNAIVDLGLFRIAAHRGSGGNEGIDRYYLTGKSSLGISLQIDAVHHPRRCLVVINFNNLFDDEVEEWIECYERAQAESSTAEATASGNW